MKICLLCSHPNSDGAMFCENCGTRLPQEPAGAQGSLMGNQNVIAGDVSNTINNTTTHIHQDDSHTTVTCAVCGKLLSKGSGQVYLCGDCGSYVCADHIDPAQHKCHACMTRARQRRQQAETERQLAPFRYQQLGNGKYVIIQLLDIYALDVTVPAGVESIAAEAFAGCRVIRVSLPDGLIAIDSGAFRDCRMLKQINIPASVLYIGDEAFRNCEKLEIALPATADLGRNVIHGTLTHQMEEQRKAAAEAARQKRLQEEAQRRAREEEARKKAAEEAQRKAEAERRQREEDRRRKAEAERRRQEEEARRKAEAEAKRKAEEARLRAIAEEEQRKKDAYKKMLADAAKHFDYAEGLLTKFHSNVASYTVPSFITRIAPEAFADCDSLRNLMLPDTIKTIGKGAFSGCIRLESINLPSTLPTIEAQLFRSCRALKSITIPRTVTTIGEEAFDHCESLTSVALPKSVIVIGAHAFRNCDKLRTVTMPDRIIEKIDDGPGMHLTPYLGGGAFQNCTSLKEVVLPNGMSSVASSLFEGCTALQSITIPNTVKTIYHSAFSECGGLTTLRLPTSVKEIYEKAFYKCTGLTRIELAASLKWIGNHAFSDCTNLTSITNTTNAGMPLCSDFISEGAFAYCSKLEKIYTGTATIYDHAFLNCGQLAIHCHTSMADFLKKNGKFIGGSKLVCKDKSCALDPNSTTAKSMKKDHDSRQTTLLSALGFAVIGVAVVCSFLLGTVADWICGAVFTAVCACPLFMNIFDSYDHDYSAKAPLRALCTAPLLLNIVLLFIFPQAYRFTSILPGIGLVMLVFILAIGTINDSSDVDASVFLAFACLGISIALVVAPIAGLTGLLNMLLYVLGEAVVSFVLWLILRIVSPKKYGRCRPDVGLMFTFVALVVLSPIALYAGLAMFLPAFVPVFLR